MILDDKEFPPVLQDEFHPEPDGPELDYQRPHDSQDFRGCPLIVPDDCQKETANSQEYFKEPLLTAQYDFLEKSETSQDFQEPPLSQH